METILATVRSSMEVAIWTFICIIVTALAITTIFVLGRTLGRLIIRRVFGDQESLKETEEAGVLLAAFLFILTLFTEFVLELQRHGPDLSLPVSRLTNRCQRWLWNTA
jgi:hypothetical protein